MSKLLNAKREQIRSLAAENGIRIDQLENGLFHVRGRFIDVKVRDLSVISPREMTKASWPRPGKDEQADVA